MDQAGSGGLGAVSVGIPEPLLWAAILVAVGLVALGGWKLIKFLWALAG